MSAPIIEARDVSLSFGSVRALRDVSLTIGPGEITALVGDNGADFCSPLTGEDNALNRAYAQRERARWGAGWILIPNPMYGQWENNVVQRKWGDENDLERLRLRRAALRGAPGK